MRTISIGRANNNDIIVNIPEVSAEHAQIIIEDSGKVIIKDLNSTNGTFVNNKKILEAELSPSDIVKVYNQVIDWQSLVTINQQPVEPAFIRTIKVGRHKSNDLVFPQMDISSFHAEIGKTASGDFFLIDKSSTNGTYVNAQKVQKCRLNAGDKILLANKYVLDWQNAFNENVPKSHGISVEESRKIKTNLFRQVSIIAASILIIVMAIWIFRDGIFSSPQKLMRKYENSVVIVVHGYVYLVEFENLGSIAVTVNDGIPDIYNSSINEPIFSAGTGFFIDREGKIVTNRHVALPWDYNDEARILIKKIVDNNKWDFWQAHLNNADKLVNENIINNTNVKVSGMTVKLGIALNNTFYEWNNLISCQTIKESGNKDIDVALLQVSDKQLPPSVKNVIGLSDAFTDYDNLEGGEDLYLLGYPFSLDWANTREGIKVTFQKGNLNHKPDDLCLGYSIATEKGASGSPVLNSKGQLVAIHNLGMEGKGNLNSGILSIYAIKLLNRF